MIDIHSHILPNIDDGSTSMQESLEIIKKAKNAGVDEIILTPHFILGSKYNIERKEKEKIFKSLQEEVKKESIDVNLYLGNEVFYEENMFSLLKEGRIHTLNNSRYLLFEIPRHNMVRGLDDAIFNLKVKNIIPILAHPERYTAYQKNPEKLLKLKEMEVLFQCNVGSFFGRYGKEAKKLAKLLAKHHMIDFLASDVHHDKHEIYTYFGILKEAGIIEEDYFNELTEKNPRKILTNEMIESKNYTIFKKNLFGKWN